MNEILRYSYLIDCNLAYYDAREMIQQFEKAKLISTDSIFRFLEELFNPPKKQISSKKVVNNIAFVSKHVYVNFEHPLKEIVFYSGKSKMDGRLLTTKKALILLNEVRSYKDFYSVVNIVLYSTRRNRNISLVENFADVIIKEWAI